MNILPPFCRIAFRAILTLGASIGLLFSAAADDGYWTATNNGSWSSAANWDSGVIANGADDNAYFGLLADVPTNLTVTLDGSRTIGSLFFTDQSGSDSVILNAGTGGPLTLNATLSGSPLVTVVQAAQQIIINVPIAGTNGLEKGGVGTLVLNGTNNYTGETLVSAGTLLVNGQLGTDVVTVASGTLGGTGFIGGPVTVQSGAALATSGTLTISNSLVLQNGSTTRVRVNASNSSHDLVQGLGTVTYGGSLVVSNLAGTPVAGQSFKLFSATTGVSNFTAISPNPAAFLRWRFDPPSGVLSVVSSISSPWISSTGLRGTNFVMVVTNGTPGATNYVLASTNLTLPLANWLRVKTNIVGATGSYAFTNAANTNAMRFYSITVSPLP